MTHDPADPNNISPKDRRTEVAEIFAILRRTPCNCSMNHT